MKYHGIVVGVDGSPWSNAAVGWAADEALRRGAPLTVVHVLAPRPERMWPPPPAQHEFERRYEERGRRLVADAVEAADAAVSADPRVSVRPLMCSGHAVPTLVDVSGDADLIVMGRQGEDAGSRRRLGSVSCGLVFQARCPVAVIHDGYPWMPRPSYAPVLVGVDGSPASELAMSLAFRAAAARGVKVIAMYCWGYGQSIDATDAEMQPDLRAGGDALEQLLVDWRRSFPDIEVEARFVYGRPSVRLIEASESAQLTVVGSRGQGGFPGMLLGPVTTAAVQSVRTPLIVAQPG